MSVTATAAMSLAGLGLAADLSSAVLTVWTAAASRTAADAIQNSSRCHLVSWIAGSSRLLSAAASCLYC
jgi:hypothetical protein